MWEIKCPLCSVKYNVDIPEDYYIFCKDCGTRYFQKTNSNRIISWIRDKILTIKNS